MNPLLFAFYGDDFTGSADAMEALSRGSYEDALQGFSNAVDLDPNFGLAYAGMAAVALNPGTVHTQMLESCFGPAAASSRRTRAAATVSGVADRPHPGTRRRKSGRATVAETSWSPVSGGPGTW